MEPAFQRGDILFLNNDDRPVEAGEIVVFKIEGREIPIVHRVLNVHEGKKRSDGTREPTRFLTKGDNNNIDDRGLYRPGPTVETERNHGASPRLAPYVGMVTIPERLPGSKVRPGRTYGAVCADQQGIVSCHSK